MGDTVTPGKSGRTKSCKAWEHFSLHQSNKFVMCKICNAELAWHGSTTVMNEHLKRKHVGLTEEGTVTSTIVTSSNVQSCDCERQQGVHCSSCIMADTGDTVTPEKSGRTKSCKAWEHFSLHQSNKFVMCKICNAELAWHGSTTVMNEHLKRKHVGLTEEGINNVLCSKRRRSTSEFVHADPPCMPAQASVLTDSVLKMLVTDMRPLSMVEDKGFKSMVSMLNPAYTLPSRTYFTKLMERKYEETFQNVKDTIHCNNSRIALTADIWTSVATEAYLGVTCHYIGDDWQMNSICLATMPLEERHTAANIAEWLEEVSDKFEIPPEKIIALVHDNAANMVSAANILEEKHGWFSIRCTGHTLQLVINAALKNTGIERVVSAARGLVEHFQKSELASSKLKEKQNKLGTAEHKLLQDVSTRWNSTYYMVDRLLEQRWPVTATLSDPSATLKGKHYRDLKPELWSVLEELSTVLKPFECAIVFMSGQEYPSLSSMPALVKGLLRFTERASFETSAMRIFQATATDQLRSRWNDVLSEQVLNPVIYSAALDPRFKRLKFLTPEQIINVQAKVQTELLAIRRNELLEVKQQFTPPSTSKADAGPAPSTSRTSSISSIILDHLLECGGGSEEDTEAQQMEDINIVIRNEVQSYFAEKPLHKDGDPLSWWKSNEDRYPTLAKLARTYLCIPSTSTPSERLFSAAGNIACKKRASLSPDHVDMLFFLHCNAKFL